jgi:hypothetical protein
MGRRGSIHFDRLCPFNLCVTVQWSVFLAANPEVSGSIRGATTFSELQWVWNVVHSALVRINEALLERYIAATV